jgi:membrane protein
MNQIEEPDQVEVELGAVRPTILRRLTVALDRSRLSPWLDGVRSRSQVVDASLAVIERDSDIGGSILAGALAYRLFVFFIPLAFLLVAALGLASKWFGTSPYEVGRDVGVVSLITKEIATTSRNGVGWWVALVALGALVYATSVLHRAVAIVNALAWQRSAAGAKAGRGSVAPFALGIGAQLVLTGVTGPLRPPYGAENVLVLLAYLTAIAAVWLAMSLRLPHGVAAWTDLLPGAALYAVGLLLVHVFNVYVLERLHESRASTYGTLGSAAAVLLGLYFIGRLIVTAAVVNATLFERRESRRGTRRGSVS